jgi:threonine/homoserine/homoserine lactone efflux protein
VEAAAFAAEVVAVSASGVLGPGPLFFANMMYGTREGARSGLKVAHGHAAVEIAVIAAISAGLFSASAFVDQYADIIAVIGGAAIIGFAIMQILALARSRNPRNVEASRSPFATGVAFTAFNPFFLVWWFTVGLKLVSDSQAFGPVTGTLFLFGAHVWMDYAWLAGTAYLASKGSSILKSKYYGLLLIVLCGVLLYYGMQFLLSGIK